MSEHLPWHDKRIYEDTDALRVATLPTIRLQDEKAAGQFLRSGKLVAFPTETVFGLGANAFEESCIQAIFEAKGRPTDNPLIVHVASSGDLGIVARDVPQIAWKLLEEFSPGPLTVVLPKADAISYQVTAGLETVAIRIPGCEVARKVLQHSQIPIAAPSANRSGKPSGTRWQSVLDDLDGRIDAILCKNTTSVGLESSVVDCTSQHPVLLRPGSIGLEDLRRIDPKSTSLAESNVAINSSVSSPGLRHPHYQPTAELVLFEDLGQLDSEPTIVGGRTLLLALDTDEAVHLPDFLKLSEKIFYESVDQFGAEFYEVLREADRMKMEKIFCQLAPNIGLGVALRDRQLRAAGKK